MASRRGRDASNVSRSPGRRGCVVMRPTLRWSHHRAGARAGTVRREGAAMSFATRGFAGRRRERDDRLPPGQTLVQDWPVLSAGPTPQIDTGDWELTLHDETGTEHRWSWDELLALGVEDVTVDIHCVTHWSRLGMEWRGVSLDKVFENVESEHEFVMAHSYGGYTTNVP